MDIPQVDEQRLLQAMEQYGGSFARNLARAWQCADSTNRARLREAFGGLLLSYLPFVEA